VDVNRHIYTYLKNILDSQFEFFWVMTPCSFVVWYQRFTDSCCLYRQGEEGGSMDLWNGGILPQHCTVSQYRRTRIFTATKTSNLAFWVCSGFVRILCIRQIFT